MKSLFVVFSIFMLIIHCSGPKGNVSPPSGVGQPPPHRLPEGTTGNTFQMAKGFIWYGKFTVRDSKEYEELLTVCNRCGAFREIPGGFKWDIALGDSPIKCKKWLYNGGLQIEFASLDLPTEVTVTLQPHYGSNLSGGCWGHPFTVKGIARASNKSKGFSIVLSPINGLGGTRSLAIESDYSNHVEHNTLSATISYGGESGSSGKSAVFTSTLVKQNPVHKRAIMDIRSVCRQYAPQSYCVGGSY